MHFQSFCISYNNAPFSVMSLLRIGQRALFWETVKTQKARNKNFLKTHLNANMTGIISIIKTVFLGVSPSWVRPA